jgi:phosphoribosylanthranilate isomerase
MIKICGLTRREDAEAAIAAGADLVGFVMVPGTPRFVRTSELGWVRDLVGAQTVGVFRDASIERVEEIREMLSLDWVQLHGDEPEQELVRLGPQVIRRVRPSGDRTWRDVERVAVHALPLVDPGAGSGVGWAWDALPPTPPELRFGLSGGLRPDTVAAVVRELGPALVDVSSGVERAPGIKDPGLVAAFIRAARDAAGRGRIDGALET